MLFALVMEHMSCSGSYLTPGLTIHMRLLYLGGLKALHFLVLPAGDLDWFERQGLGEFDHDTYFGRTHRIDATDMADAKEIYPARARTRDTEEHRNLPARMSPVLVGIANERSAGAAEFDHSPLEHGPAEVTGESDRPVVIKSLLFSLLHSYAYFRYRHGTVSIFLLCRHNPGI